MATESQEPEPEIIDSSAVTKYFAKEPGWATVEKYIASGDSLELAVKETANALWKKILKKEVKLETAQKLVQALMDTIWLLDQSQYIERALEIASEYKITLYDSLFLACAEARHAKLVSCDSRQLDIASQLGIRTVAV